MAMLPYVPPPEGSNPIWYPINSAQITALESSAQALLFGGASGGGKGLALDTPLPSPDGFVLMRDVAVGTTLFGSDGKPCTVTGVSAVSHRRCFRVCFEDGSEIIADDVHRWRTLDYKTRRSNDRRSEEVRAARRAARPSRAIDNPRKPAVQRNVTAMNRARVYQYAEPSAGGVIDTLAIKGSLYTGGMYLNHCIPLALPIECPETVLPLDPYLLGLWLGDGQAAQPVIGMEEGDCREVLTHVTQPIKSEKVYPAGYRSYKKPFMTVRFAEMLPQLRSLGVLGCKRIPGIYLRASEAQRRALLAGILDTDGHCDKRGMIEVGLSDEALCADVAELICSLGIKGVPRPKKTYAKTCWRLKFLCSFPAFRLLRKAERQKLSGFRDTVTRRYICAVEEIASVPTKCLTVDSADHMYLAGRQMVPTHNTDFLVADAMQEISNPNFRGLIIRRSLGDFAQISDRCNELYRPFGGRSSDNGKLWRFPSGASIQFRFMRADKDWESFQGRPYSWLGIDEGGHQTEGRIRKILPWLAPRDSTLRRRVRITANPGGIGAGWLMNMFLGGKCPIHAKPKIIEPGAVYRGSRWLGDNKPTLLTTCFVPALVTDNRFYGQEKIDMLRNQEGAMADKLLAGCWCELEGAYFPFIKPSTEDEDSPFQYPLALLNPQWWWNHIIGIDYGYGNSAAAAGMYCSTPSGKKAKINEMVNKRRGSADFAKDIAEAWIEPLLQGNRRDFVGIYFDPAMNSHTGTGKSNKELMQEVFEPFGIPMIPAAKDRPGGAQALYRGLSSGDLIITDACPKTFESLRTRVHDDKPGRGTDVKKVHGDPMDDLYDETVYSYNNYSPGTELTLEMESQRKIEDMRESGMDEDSLAKHSLRMQMELRSQSIGPMQIGRRRRR